VRVELNNKSAVTNTPIRQLVVQPTVPQPTLAQAAVPPVMAADYQLTILHTNDAQGYLDPCG
jgi:2',3'-cyclic-nucleotide 2'-phosphodiesterase (5'-nucleotidase family)